METSTCFPQCELTRHRVAGSGVGSVALGLCVCLWSKQTFCRVSKKRCGEGEAESLGFGSNRNSVQARHMFITQSGWAVVGRGNYVEHFPLSLRHGRPLNNISNNNNCASRFSSRPLLRNIIMKNKGEIEMQIKYVFAINIRVGNVQKHVTKKKCIANPLKC